MAINFIQADTLNIGDYILTIPQDECFNIPFTCDNCTSVNLTIAYPNGSIIIDDGVMTSENGYHYNYSFCNTTETGRYFISFHYDEDGRYIYTDSNWVMVTPNGVTLKEGNSILYSCFLFLILSLLIISIIGTFQVENYIGKFTMYWVTHLLFILWTFSVWQISNGFLIGYVGFAGIFRVLFYIGMFSAFPMIILSLAWIFYIHTFNEHFQKLIDKGGNTEEAFRMAKRKTGGWFSGRS